MNSQELSNIFISRGYKMTVIRKIIIEFVSSSQKPFSAVELRNFVLQKVKVNKTTLYRQLHFLEKEKMIKKILFEDGIIRYELALVHHHHAICTSCHSVIDIPGIEDLQKQEKIIALEKKFKVVYHSLEFFGVCAQCQNQKKEY